VNGEKLFVLGEALTKNNATTILFILIVCRIVSVKVLSTPLFDGFELKNYMCFWEWRSGGVFNSPLHQAQGDNPAEGGC